MIGDTIPFELYRKEFFFCKNCVGVVEARFYRSCRPINERDVFKLKEVAKCQNCNFEYRIFGSLIGGEECF